MGHLIFCILHLCALLFGFIGLFLTIPLHLIYSAAKKPSGLREDGKRQTGGIFGGIIDEMAIRKKMTNCPFCKEMILKGAVICKHCGQNIPAEEVPQEIEIYESLDFDKKAGPFNKRVSEISGINLAIILSALLLLFFLFAPFNG